jgi:hypothetical protein
MGLAGKRIDISPIAGYNVSRGITTYVEDEGSRKGAYHGPD